MKGLGDLGLLIYALNDFLEAMIHFSSISPAFPQNIALHFEMMSTDSSSLTGHYLLLTPIIAHQKTTFKLLSRESASVGPSSALHKVLLRN